MPVEIKATPIKRSRKIWIAITWLLTWWIPTPILYYCCGLRRKDIRTAWREKVAIFIIITSLCLAIMFFIVLLPQILCPKEDIMSIYEIEALNKLDKAYVTIYGRYYDITDVVNSHINKIGVNEFQMQSTLGKDNSQMFFPAIDWNSNCPGIKNPGSSWDNILARDPERFWPHYELNSKTNTPKNYISILRKYAKGRIGWQKDYLLKLNDPARRIVVMYNNVYDIAPYFQGTTQPGFFDDNMYAIFTNMIGKDATPYMAKLMKLDPVYYRNVLNCMNNLFYIGIIDNRNSFVCQLSNYILLGASGIICFVILIKFLAALRSMHTLNPENQKKHVIIQVPCYTEDKESLLATIKSIAKTDYDHNLKLLFLICDGIVTGEGNNMSTPDIALEILFDNEEGVSAAKLRSQTLYIPDENNEENTRDSLYTYQAVANGSKVENRAQIYSGIYKGVPGAYLPFIVVVKCGNKKETSRHGNRGKRDSQILLLNFLSNIHARRDLSHIDYGIFYHMQQLSNYSTTTTTLPFVPKDFEYVLMVDADTYITEDSITKLVSCMVSNVRIVGLCGETLINNEKDSWTTMIQVYEYFISHHLSKAFESMFGSVTCLPGCFSMYRLKTQDQVPLLISNTLIEDYADTRVDTLHKKNLLSLGEDRYLTTLVMKHFPSYKTMFTTDAKCFTRAPDNFVVLRSQRRRWINSTVHNLVELSRMRSNLCGFCCFSMRFVVMLDLISTVVAPASVAYIVYLVYLLVVDHSTVPIISLIIIASIYGLQAIIFILKQQFAHIFWMLFYILATPIFSFYFPLYSFWHMDDFNWGNTRIVKDSLGRDVENLEEDNIFSETKSFTKMSLQKWKLSHLPISSDTLTSDSTTKSKRKLKRKQKKERFLLESYDSSSSSAKNFN